MPYLAQFRGNQVDTEVDTEWIGSGYNILHEINPTHQNTMSTSAPEQPVDGLAAARAMYAPYEPPEAEQPKEPVILDGHQQHHAIMAKLELIHRLLKQIAGEQKTQ